MTDDRVVRLAEDLFRLLVNANGGFPGGEPGEAARESVRQARAFYAEIDHPTKPSKKKPKPQPEEETDEGAMFE